MRIHTAKAAALALAVLTLSAAFAVMAPTAAAYHGCAPHVGVDAGHAPANTWSNHNHPLFTWNAWGCRVVTYGVQPSWGGYFETGGNSYHPTLGEIAGGYINVRTLYAWDHTHSYQELRSFQHLHSYNHVHQECGSWWRWWGCNYYNHTHYEWHTHYYWETVYYNHVHHDWTGWVDSARVYIDTLAPVSSISWGAPRVDDGRNFVTSATQFVVSSTDGASGVAAQQYTIDGALYGGRGPFSLRGADGYHTIGFRALDNAGNWEAWKYIRPWLDNTPPVSKIAFGAPQFTGADGTFFIDSVTPVTLTASDPLSGVGVKTTYFKIDDAQTTYSGTFTVPMLEDGFHTISYWSVDRLGNREATKSIEIFLDNSIPAQKLTHPTYNSLNAADFSIESCDAEMVTKGHETPEQIGNAAAAAAITDGKAQFAQATGMPFPEAPAMPTEQEIKDAFSGATGQAFPAAPELPPAPELPALPALPEAPAAPAAPATPEIPAAPIGTEDIIPPAVMDQIEAAQGQLPPLPDAPDAPAVDEPTPPTAPTAPTVITSEPALCNGHILSTAEQTVTFTMIEAPEAPEAPESPVPLPEAPETPALPASPVEIPAAPAAPELPAIAPPPMPEPAIPAAPVGPRDVIPEALQGDVMPILETPMPSPPAPPPVEQPGLPTPPTVPDQIEEKAPAQSADFQQKIILVGKVNIEVFATDDFGVGGSGVNRVEFWVDGILRHTDTDSAYSWLWDTTTETANDHQLTIRTFDNLGHEAKAIEVSVTVIPTNKLGMAATSDERQAQAGDAAADAQATADGKIQEIQGTQPPTLPVDAPEAPEAPEAPVDAPETPEVPLPPTPELPSP